MHNNPGFVTPEVVAIITAALACALDTTADNLRIRSIQPAAQPAAAPGGAWAKAGVLEQHMIRRLGPVGR
jgi:hypothetical protein